MTWTQSYVWFVQLCSVYFVKMADTKELFAKFQIPNCFEQSTSWSNFAWLCLISTSFVIEKQMTDNEEIQELYATWKNCFEQSKSYFELTLSHLIQFCTRANLTEQNNTGSLRPVLKREVNLTLSVDPLDLSIPLPFNPDCLWT